MFPLSLPSLQSERAETYRSRAHNQMQGKSPSTYGIRLDYNSRLQFNQAFAVQQCLPYTVQKMQFLENDSTYDTTVPTRVMAVRHMNSNV